MKKISLGSISIIAFIACFYTFIHCMTDNALESPEIYSEMVKAGTTTTTTEETPIVSMDKYYETGLWNAPQVTYTTITETTITTTPPPITTTTAATTQEITVATTTAVTTALSEPAAIPAEIVPVDPNYQETLSYVVNGRKYSLNAYDAVCQIVTAEMGATFHEEALKAQAIATYSYLKYNNERDISPSVSAKTPVPSKISEAVKSVFGITAYYDGSIAQTVYCASTGGSSTAAGDVWSKNVPYLTSVESQYDYLDPNYGLKKVMSVDEVRTIVESTTNINLSSNPENWFTLVDQNTGGYNGEMLIDGHSSYSKNGNNITITGRVIRENIFAFRLRSAKFDVTYDDNKFTFTTYGYGHGVGMSQNGANLYAINSNYNYSQILSHYFPEIVLQ